MLLGLFYGRCICWRIRKIRDKSRYQNESQFQIVESVVMNLRPIIPPYCPQTLSLLMQRCWDSDPNNRPNFEEVKIEIK